MQLDSFKFPLGVEINALSNIPRCSLRGKETITIANKQQHLLLLLPNEEKEKIPKMFWLDSLINVAKLTLTSFFAADDDDDLLFS